MIEDDHRLATMVRSYLSASGFEVAVADDAARGLRLLDKQAFDLVLLDLMLPDADGLNVCRQIRGNSAIPIIMVTAKGDITDRVVGLELGADDYLAKPFEPRELLARIRAVLRRHQGSTSAPGQVLAFGRLEIDVAARQVRLAGQLRDLTSRQYELLLVMAQRSGRVLTRDQLVDYLPDHGADSGADRDTVARAIDVHIGKIRLAIEEDPHHPRRIITVRGAGYVFAKAQE